MDRFTPEVQWARLKEFAAVLNCWPKALRRRDEHGNPYIEGSRGRVYAGSGFPKDGLRAVPGVSIWLNRRTRQAWTLAKRKLSFAVVQDGDTEGVFYLDHAPTLDEAVRLRKYLGVRKRVELSDADRVRRRELMRGLWDKRRRQTHELDRERELSAGHTSQTSDHRGQAQGAGC